MNTTIIRNCPPLAKFISYKYSTVDEVSWESLLRISRSYLKKTPVSVPVAPLALVAAVPMEDREITPQKFSNRSKNDSYALLSNIAESSFTDDTEPANSPKLSTWKSAKPPNPYKLITTDADHQSWERPRASSNSASPKSFSSPSRLKNAGSRNPSFSVATSAMPEDGEDSSALAISLQTSRMPTPTAAERGQRTPPLSARRSPSPREDASVVPASTNHSWGEGSGRRTPTPRSPAPRQLAFDTCYDSPAPPATQSPSLQAQAQSQFPSLRVTERLKLVLRNEGQGGIGVRNNKTASVARDDTYDDSGERGARGREGARNGELARSGVDVMLRERSAGLSEFAEASGCLLEGWVDKLASTGLWRQVFSNISSVTGPFIAVFRLLF